MSRMGKLRHFPQIVGVWLCLVWAATANAAIQTDYTLEYSPDPLLSGDLATFTLSYIAADGSSACPNPELTMVLSEYVDFSTASADGEHTPDGSGATGGFVYWDKLPTFNQNKFGEVVVRGNIQVGLPDNEPIVLDVSMKGINGEDCGDAIFAPPANPAPVLQVNKSASREIAQPGQTFNYTLDFTNTGNQTARNLVMTDDLPSDIEFVSASGDFTYTPGTPATVTWSYLELEVDSTISEVINVRVKDPTPVDTIIVNTVLVTGENESGQTLDPAMDEVQVEVTSKPILKITKTAEDTVLSGGTLNYSITYENTGDTTAVSAQIVDTYSNVVADISSIDGGGVENEANRTITWALGDILPGQSGQLAYAAVIQDGLLTFSSSSASRPPDTVDNTAIISASNADDNSASHSAGVIQPTPSLEIIKQGPANADAGTTVEYTLRFTNNGSAPSINTVVEDFAPQECVDVVADGGTYDPATNSARWEIGLLGVSQSGAVSLSCQLGTPIPDGTQITNTGSIFSANGSPDTSQVVTVIRSQPLLTIEKMGTPDPVKPGDQLQYTYRISNSGNADATMLRIEDFLDENVMYLSDSLDGTYSPTENKVTWEVATLSTSQPIEIVMFTVVDAGLIGNVALDNSVTVGSAETEAVSTEETVQVATEAKFILSKTASQTVVAPGDQVTYTLSYENTGNDVAVNTVLTDSLPLEVIYGNSSDGGLEDSGVVTWNLGDVPVGAKGTITLTVQVNSPLSNNTSIENSASIQSDGTQPVSATNTITVASQAILFLEKTADRSVVALGDNVNYELSYGNTGNANATNVLLTDSLPAKMSFVSASGGGTFAGGVVSWPADDLNVGSTGTVSFIAKVEGPADDGEEIRNTASIDSDQTTPTSASDDVTVEYRPVIALTKTASKTIAIAGDEITFVLDIENSGNAFATGVVLKDEIPANTSFISATEGYTLDGNVVSWGPNQLPIDADGQLTLTVKIDDAAVDDTVISNTASIASDQTSPLLANAKVAVQSLPRFTLSKIADAEFVEAGRNVLFNLAYKNTGTAIGTNVILEDIVPGDMEYVSSTGGGIYDATTGKVTWTDPGLEAGASGQVTLTLRVNDSVPNDSTIENTASITAELAQSVSASDTVTVKRTPVLELAKVADVSFVTPGDEISYTLNFSNSGNATARGVVLEDPVPTNTTLVSASNGGIENGGIVRWSFDELPVGEEGSVSMVVQVNPTGKVNSALEQGDSIYNSATIDSPDANAATANISVPVQLEPELALTKTAEASFVDAGELVSFTLEFSNTGNAAAANVTLTDQIPSNMTFVDASPGYVFDGSANAVSWTAGKLEAGSTGQVYVVMRVDVGTADGTDIVNIAELNADNSLVKNASDSVTVRSAPALNLGKVADRNFVGPGEIITYELTYSNTGNAVAADVTLEDTIPANTTLESLPPNAALVGDTVVWSFPTLAIGGTGSVSLSVRVDAEAPVDAGVDNGTIIHNVATLDSPTTAAVSAEDDVTVKVAPLLELEKAASAEVVKAGQEVAYSIAYSNTGNGRADAVVITDRIPTNMSYVSSPGGSLVGDVVEWDLGALTASAQGSVTLTLLVNSDAPDGSNIVNTAQIDSADTAPVSDSATIKVSASPILHLTKEADLEVAGPGDLITFVLEFANTGNAAAINLVLSDRVPDSTEFVSATGGGVLSGNIVTWAESQLLAGASGSVSLTVRVSSTATLNTASVSGTTITNIATLNSDNGQPQVAQDVVAIQQYPILNLQKTADASVVSPGETITYTLSYANTGNLDATVVTLTDPIPEYTTFLSASGEGELVGNSVSWSFASLPPGYSGAVTFTVQVKDPISKESDSGININNIATLDAGAQAPSVTASAQVTVDAQPVPGLTKDADVSFAQPGQNITYTIAFSNTGNTAITNATLTDGVPANTRFVAASNLGTEQGGIVTWPIGLLAAGAEGGVTLTVVVNDLVPDGTVIRNNANLDSGDQAPIVSAQDEVYVEATASLLLEKTASNRLIAPGENVVYSLAYGNNGNAIARNTTLVEAIPANTVFVSASEGGVVNGANVEWSLGDLTPGASGVVTFEVTVNADLTNGAIVHNTATLDSDDAPPIQSGATVAVYSLETSPVQLGVSIEGTPTSIEAGSEATYVISYSNLTNITATNPTIASLIPSNADFMAASDGGVLDQSVVPNRIRWSLATLAGNAGGTVSFTVRHRVSTPVAAFSLLMDEVVFAAFAPVFAAPVAAATPPLAGLRIAESLVTIGGVNADNAASPVIATAQVQVIIPTPSPEPPKAIPLAGPGAYFVLVLFLLLQGVIVIRGRVHA